MMKEEKRSHLDFENEKALVGPQKHFLPRYLFIPLGFIANAWV